MIFHVGISSVRNLPALSLVISNLAATTTLLDRASPDRHHARPAGCEVQRGSWAYALAFCACAMALPAWSGQCWRMVVPVRTPAFVAL